MFILSYRHKDAVLLQLKQVCHSQLVGLEKCELQRAGQKPDLSVHM